MRRHAGPGLALATALTALACARAVQAQDVAAFEKKITVKTLANGLTVLVCERPEAPVFSFTTYADVGSVQEVPGITGLAHVFEHMAFKGTPHRHHRLRGRAARPRSSRRGVRGLEAERNRIAARPREDHEARSNRKVQPPRKKPATS